MATNLNIDLELLEAALEIGGYKTKKETVNQALREFILRRRQQQIKKLFGTIDYEQNYDYKKLRSRS